MTSKQVTSPPWNSRRGAQAKKWFGHCAGRSPCAHSIGKFFLCYIVLFLLETSAPGLSGHYWYNIYVHESFRIWSNSRCKGRTKTDLFMRCCILHWNDKPTLGTEEKCFRSASWRSIESEKERERGIESFGTDQDKGRRWSVDVSSLCTKSADRVGVSWDSTYVASTIHTKLQNFAPQNLKSKIRNPNPLQTPHIKNCYLQNSKEGVSWTSKSTSGLPARSVNCQTPRVSISARLVQVRQRYANRLPSPARIQTSSPPLQNDSKCGRLAGWIRLQYLSFCSLPIKHFCANRAMNRWWCSQLEYSAGWTLVQ